MAEGFILAARSASVQVVIKKAVPGLCGARHAGGLVWIAMPSWGTGRPHVKSGVRSEEHTSELQSPCNLVCRLLLEKKKRTEYILHRNFTRRQVAIQNMVASNIGISQSTFSVKVLHLFSRSRRQRHQRNSEHRAML